LREITSALASGASINSVAKQFHFTTPTMWKHAKRHTGAALLATNIAEPTLTAIRRLNERTVKILDAAERGKDPTTALAAIREARRNLELIGRLTGELRESGNGGGDGRLQIEVTYIDKQLVVSQSAPEQPLLPEAPNQAFADAESLPGRAEGPGEGVSSGLLLERS